MKLRHLALALLLALGAILARQGSKVASKSGDLAATGARSAVEAGSEGLAGTGRLARDRATDLRDPSLRALFGRAQPTDASGLFEEVGAHVRTSPDDCKTALREWKRDNADRITKDQERLLESNSFLARLCALKSIAKMDRRFLDEFDSNADTIDINAVIDGLRSDLASSDGALSAEDYAAVRASLVHRVEIREELIRDIMGYHQTDRAGALEVLAELAQEDESGTLGTESPPTTD